MSRGSDGTYDLPLADVITQTTITSDWANQTLGDLAVEMTDSLSRSGKGGMKDVLTLIDGATGTLALNFLGDASSGMYYDSGYFYLQSAGTPVARYGATGMQYWDGSTWVNPLTESQTTGFVTTGTTQTITGAKTFTKAIKADQGVVSNTSVPLIDEVVDGNDKYCTVGDPGYTSSASLFSTTDASAQVFSPSGSSSIVTTKNADTTLAAFKAELLNEIYPVGSVKYTSNDVNPGGVLPGSWSRVAEGRFVASVGSATDADGVTGTLVAGDGNTGRYYITLLEENVPSHTHSMSREQNVASGSNIYRSTSHDPGNPTPSQAFSSPWGGDGNGDTTSFINLPPYTGLYVWERVS